MYQLLIFSVLNFLLVSAAVTVNNNAVQTDGDQKDYGRAYSKKYGYNKVVVTTYVVPKMVPSSSYSTYIIHPVGVTHCGYTAMDSDSAPSLQKVEIKTEDIPVNGYSVEDHTMDRRVIANYAMNFKSVDDQSADGQVMEGRAMNGYVVEGHAKNGYVIDGYQEENLTEDELRKGMPQFNDKYVSAFDNTIDNNPDEQYKEWYKSENLDDEDDYWEKLRKEFDAYYEEQYQKLFDDQHPYESNAWNGQVEVKPNMIFTNRYEDNNGKDFLDFQQNLAYLRGYEGPFYRGTFDFKPQMAFINGNVDGSDKEIIDIQPKMTFMHGYEGYNQRLDNGGALRVKKGYRFSHGDFDFGFGSKEKYEPKWR